MYNSLLYCTFLALLLFFVSIEIYRYKNVIKGTVVEFCHSDIVLDEMISTRLKIQLNTGEIVEAEAMRCTICLGHFSVGDEVQLHKSKEKYYVNLPFTFTKKRTCSPIKS